MKIAVCLLFTFLAHVVFFYCTVLYCVCMYRPSSTDCITLRHFTCPYR